MKKIIDSILSRETVFIWLNVFFTTALFSLPLCFMWTSCMGDHLLFDPQSVVGLTLAQAERAHGPASPLHREQLAKHDWDFYIPFGRAGGMFADSQWLYLAVNEGNLITDAIIWRD